MRLHSKGLYKPSKTPRERQWRSERIDSKMVCLHSLRYKRLCELAVRVAVFVALVIVSDALFYYNYDCKWPARNGMNIMVLSDIHIPGAYSGVCWARWDALWQLSSFLGGVARVASDADVVVDLGDATHLGWYEEQTFDEYKVDYMHRQFVTESIRKRAPEGKIHVIPGNHDAGCSTERLAWFSSVSGVVNPSVTTFDADQARFVSWYKSCARTAIANRASGMSLLAGGPKCTVCMIHEPSSSTAERIDLCRNCSLVLSGHDHQYERHSYCGRDEPIISEFTTSTANDAGANRKQETGITLISLPLNSSGYCNTEFTGAAKAKRCFQPNRTYHHAVVMLLLAVTLVRGFFSFGWKFGSYAIDGHGMYYRIQPASRVRPLSHTGCALVISIAAISVVFLYLMPLTGLDRYNQRMVQCWIPPTAIFVTIWVKWIEYIVPSIAHGPRWTLRFLSLALFLLVSALTARSVRQLNFNSSTL